MGVTREKSNVAKVLEAAAELDEARGSDELEKVWFERTVPIAKIDDEKRIVYGVVYEPDVADSHDDEMTAAEIEKAAHSFMSRYAKATGHLGTDHIEASSPDEVTVIESYLAPEPFKLGTQDVSKGSWVLGAKIHDDALWKGVKSGQFTGWSFEGWGSRVAA